MWENETDSVYKKAAEGMENGSMKANGVTIITNQQFGVLSNVESGVIWLIYGVIWHQ